MGDRFRITGELMESDLWSVGVTGEYSVMLKAQGGKQDLPVFVDRSLTTGWGDRTRGDGGQERGEDHQRRDDRRVVASQVCEDALAPRRDQRDVGRGGVDR